MAKFNLQRHPESPAGPQLILKTGMHRRTDDNFLVATFGVYGEIDAVAWPDPARQGRADSLWQHSCFEMFIQATSSVAYTELNFAPGRQWAVYGFDDYRSGMQNEMGVVIHRMDWVVRDLSIPRAEMHVLVELPSALMSEDWRVGLSAVIEAKDGTKSYWALAHAPGPPDFHNSDCFIATLPAPDAP